MVAKPEGATVNFDFVDQRIKELERANDFEQAAGLRNAVNEWKAQNQTNNSNEQE